MLVSGTNETRRGGTAEAYWVAILLLFVASLRRFSKAGRSLSESMTHNIFENRRGGSTAPISAIFTDIERTSLSAARVDVLR
jgi:hypothetical protein